MKVKPVKHAGSGGPLMALPSMLKGLPDMERGITRIFHRTANPAEFVQVLQALVNIAPQLGMQVSMWSRCKQRRSRRSISRSLTCTCVTVLLVLCSNYSNVTSVAANIFHAHYCRALCMTVSAMEYSLACLI